MPSNNRTTCGPARGHAGPAGSGAVPSLGLESSKGPSSNPGAGLRAEGAGATLLPWMMHHAMDAAAAMADAPSGNQQPPVLAAAAAEPGSAGGEASKKRKAPVLINVEQLVAEGKLQLGRQVWRLGQNKSKFDVDVVVERNVAGAVRFVLPGDATKYARVGPVGKVAWNKLVAAAADDPEALGGWKKRRPCQAFQPREVFVPVQETLQTGTTIRTFKRIADL